MKPLICSPSPRDIEEVKRALDGIKCPKLFAKYYNELEAYRRLRDYFLEHPEYTHMVICPDDTVVTADVFNVLLDDIRLFDYPYVAGVQPLQYDDNRYAVRMTFNNLEGDSMTEKDMAIECERQGSPIIKVAWESFACVFLRRDVVEQIPFRSEGETGQALDYFYGVDCKAADIPVMVDTRLKMVHLKNKLELVINILTATRGLNITHADAHMSFES